MRLRFRLIPVIALLFFVAAPACAENVYWELEEYVDGYFNLYYQGRYAEAAESAEEALNIVQSKFGLGHLNMGICLTNLAALKKINKRYKEAEGDFLSAKEVYEQSLGGENPMTAKLINYLAEMAIFADRGQEAEDLLLQAQGIIQGALGNKHPELAPMQNNFGILLMKKRKFAEAEASFKNAYALIQGSLGEGHPHLIRILGNLGQACYKQDKTKEAEDCFRQVWEIFKHAFMREGATVRQALEQVESERHRLWQKQNEPLYNRLMDLNDMYISPYHPEVVDFISLLPALYIQQHRFAEAELVYQSISEIMMGNIGFEHPNIAKLMRRMADYYEKAGDKEKARSLRDHAQASAVRNRRAN